MSRHKRHRRDRDRDEDIERGRDRRRDRNGNRENVQSSNNINSAINNMNGNNIMDMLNNIDQDQLNSIMQSLGVNNSLMGNMGNADDMTSGGNMANMPPVQDKTLQLLYTLKPMLTPDKAILIDRIIQIYSLGKVMNG